MEALEGLEAVEVDMNQDTQALIEEDIKQQKEAAKIDGKTRAEQYYRNATEISKPN